MKKFIFASAILGAVAASQAVVVIDDFTVGFGGFYSTVGSRVAVQNGSSSSIVTGQRDIQVDIASNPLNQVYDVAIGCGFVVNSQGTLLDGSLKLQYDGNDGQPVGFGATLLNGSASSNFLAGQNQIDLTWIYNDPVAVNVTIELFNGNTLLQSVSGVRAGLSGAGIQSFSISSAAANAANNLVITLDGGTSADYALGRVEAVPEPATMTALALGAAAMLRRRNRKK